MFNITVSVVDHPAARLAFALVGIVVGGLFVLFGIDFLRVDPFSEKTSFTIGLCMLLGQIGWWARVSLKHAFYRTRPAIRLIELLLLCIGIAIVIYGLAFMPKGPLAVPLLLTLLISGILMLFGTVNGDGSGA